MSAQTPVERAGRHLGRDEGQNPPKAPSCVESAPQSAVSDAERLAAIRKRAERATPGPWSAANEHELLGTDAEAAWCVSRMRPGYEEMSPKDGYLHDVAEVFGVIRETNPDAAFIAHARDDVPWLLDRVEALTAEVADLRDAKERAQKAEAERDEARAALARVEAALARRQSPTNRDQEDQS